jgi:trehalose 6-phosphate phosphatase
MIYLLSDEGRDALRTVASRSVLYAFDFDRALTKTSTNPGSIKLPPTTHEWLRELARRVPCAIVSGRPLHDLAPRLNGAVPYLIGSHGVESPLTPAAALTQMETACLEWMKQLDGDIARLPKDNRIEVENTRYSLTFHYRGADDPSTVEQALVHLGNRLTPAPHLVFGKASMTLLPPGSTGKGEAVLALMAHLRCTGLFFVGDDETDEDVFELKEGLIMGVRVGRHPESGAQYYLKHQSEVEDILRFLVHRSDGTPETARSK